jgi:hypothetical protein
VNCQTSQLLQSSRTSSVRRRFPKRQKIGLPGFDFLPKYIELLLRDVDAKGYLDIELVYRLRQKESLGSVKQKIVRKIQQNESAVCFEGLVGETLEGA